MLTRLFESFANTLLDLGLPKINEWLRSRLGPHADIGAVTSQGRRVLLERVSIPIGPRGLLTLDQATCTLGKANTVATATTKTLPTARLSSFEGVLRFAAVDTPSFEAEVRFEETESDENAWVHGRLTIVNATWTILEPSTKNEIVREGHVPMNGAARLVVTSSVWSLEEGELRTGSADVRFSGGGQLSSDDKAESLSQASLSAKDARAHHFFDAIAALADAPLPIAFPAALGDPMLSGSASWSNARGKCDATIDADAFKLSIHGAIGGDDLALDARVKGDVSIAKMLAIALAQPAPSSADLGAGMEHLGIDLTIDGTPARPNVKGKLTAGALRVLPLVTARDVDVAITTDHERFSAAGGWSIGDAGGGGGGGVVIRADVPFAPSSAKSVDLSITEMDAPTIAALAKTAGLGEMIAAEGDEGTNATFAIPRFTRASSELRVSLSLHGGTGEEGTTIHGAIVLDTPRSALKLDPFCFAKGRADGTRLTGSLAIADAISAGLFPFDIHPHPASSSAISGELTIDGPANDLVLDGKVTSRHLELALASRADVPPFVFDDVAGHMRFTRTDLAYDDFAGRAYGGTIRVKGKVPFNDASTARPIDADRLLVTIDDADAGLVDALARLATGGVLVRRERRREPRPKDELWIPYDAKVTGEARLDASMKLTADLALEHGETALLSKIVLSPAPDLRLDDSRITGRIAIADALLAGAFDTTMRPLPEHTARIDATLHGRFDDAVLSGTATAPRLRVAMPSSPDVPAFTITDLSTVFRIDRAKIVWHKLIARAYGGKIESSGLIGYSEKLTGLRAAAEWNDVDVALLPIHPGDASQKADRFVKGKLRGRMRFNRTGPDAPQNPIVGNGDATLVEPEYPVLLLAGPMVSRYGLPPPGPVGAGNLTVIVELHAQGWRLKDVTASVDDCLVTGSIDLGFDASLHGRCILNFGERYLRKSRLLTIPAVFAQNVELPIHIAGVLKQPVVHTDVASSLGRLMMHNRVTGILDEAVSDLGALIGVGRSSSTKTTVAAPVEDDDDDPIDPMVDEDEIVREMIAKGEDWDAIEWRLEEIRRKRPRFRVE